MPHGFQERAQLHIAEAAFYAGEYESAARQANALLEESSVSLYADDLRLVIADSSVALGDTPKALALYGEVGKVKIGFEAHYARYRTGSILRAQGKEQGEVLLNEVIKWAERGERGALLRVLKNEAPLPPLAM